MKTNTPFLPLIGLMVCWLLNPPATSSQDWTLLNPYPTPSDLYGAYLAHDGSVIISGQYNTLLRSTDDGELWFTCGSFPGFQYRKFAFPTPDTGFLAGLGHIYMTIDGGESWFDKGQIVSAQLQDIFFIDKLHGWIVGDQQSLLRTTDGGNTWQKLSYTSMSMDMYTNIRFISTDTGYLLGKKWSTPDSNILRKTTDGGMTWTDIPVPLAYREYKGLWYESGNNLYLGAGPNYPCPSGAASCMVHSSDDGINWETITMGPESEYMCDIERIDQNNWRVLGKQGCFVSFDNMVTWQHTFFAGGEVLFDWAWSDPMHGIAVGSNGKISTTSDGGLTWNEKNSGIRLPINSINFIDEQNGLMATNTSFGAYSFYYSHDGGENWMNGECDSANLAGCIKEVTMATPQLGWAFNYSNVFRTTDGGAHWQWVNLEIKPTGIFCKDASHIWISGQEGKMAISSDGGTSWQTSFIGNSSIYFEQMSFGDYQTGYAVTSSYLLPALYKTTNGGLTWDQMNYPNTGYMINTLQFLTPDTGFLTVRESGLTMTTDGGNSWTEPIPIEGEIPTGGRFFGNGKGVVTVGDRFIAITDDNGVTWQVRRDETGLGFCLKSCFVSQSKGWGFGYSYSIARYSDLFVSTGEPPAGSESRWQISPNPVGNTFSIRGRSSGEKLLITICDLAGRQVVAPFNTTTGTMLETATLQPGSYMLNITAPSGNQSIKLIKQ